MDNESTLSSENTAEQQNTEKNSWDDLKSERLLERVQMYRKFGKVALALNRMETPKTEEIPEEEVKNPAEVVGETPDDMQSEALLAQIEEALRDVDRSLENQIEYSIINHKQINTFDALKNEFESGSSIPELDIRFDKEGKTWISHSQRAGARFWDTSLSPTSTSKTIGASLYWRFFLVMLASV